MSELTPSQEAILEMAVEDYHGLWEVVWQLRSLRPELSPGTVIEAARQDVEELIRRDLIRMYQRDDAAGRPVPLDPTESRGHLFDPNDWEEPSPRRPEILVGATDLGERRYYRPQT